MSSSFGTRVGSVRSNLSRTFSDGLENHGETLSEKVSREWSQGNLEPQPSGTVFSRVLAVAYDDFLQFISAGKSNSRAREILMRRYQRRQKKQDKMLLAEMAEARRQHEESSGSSV